MVYNRLQMTVVEDFAQKRKNAPKRAFSFLLGEPSSDSSPSALWKKEKESLILAYLNSSAPVFWRFLKIHKNPRFHMPNFSNFAKVL
jgi:hypothetical protein